MFLINVQIDLCLRFPVDVWPYARVLACECNEVIVELCAQTEVFLYLEEHLCPHLWG